MVKKTAGAMLLCGVLGAGPVMALPTASVERTYFETARLKKEVGFEVRPSCSGSASALNGRRSRFSVRVSDPCPGGHGKKSVVCNLDGHVTVCPANICESRLVDCH